MQEFFIRPAQKSDLYAVNSIISSCVMSWNLPERVKRLTLTSYHYDDLDFEHLEIFVAIDSDKQVVGVAALEAASSSDLPQGKSGLLLHGLYIHSSFQKLGMGKQLIEFSLQQVVNQGRDGLLVKAQADVVSYFQKCGFEYLPVTDPDKDYPHRWWKMGL